ncbi:MAG: serine/threonine-protein kinase [Myxococcota bacterium]
MSPVTLGDVVGQRYRVDELVGVGGMGRVFRGVDLVLDRPVALKALAPEIATEEREQERLRREADALARLAHPHIVSSFELVEDEHPVLVLEWVSGKSVRHLLDQKGPLPLEEVARIGVEIATALSAAHAIGVVHRDIKPANVLLEGNTVKVADFGLAYFHEGNAPRLTGMDHILGTPEYMSPERFSSLEVTPAADIYALGVMLYELRTGRTPISGAPLEIAYRTMHAKTIELDLEDDPPAFKALLEAMVRPDEKERLQSCEEIAERLRAFSGVDDEELSDGTIVVVGGISFAEIRTAETLGAELGQQIGEDIVVCFPRTESAFRWVLAQRETHPNAHFAIEQGPVVGAGLGIFAGMTVATAARLVRLARPGDLFVAPSARQAMGIGYRGNLEVVGHLHLAGASEDPTIHRARGGCAGRRVDVDVLSSQGGVVHFRCECGAEDIVRAEHVGEAGRVHCNSCGALLTLRLEPIADGSGTAPTRDVLRFDLEENELLSALAEYDL